MKVNSRENRSKKRAIAKRGGTPNGTPVGGQAGLRKFGLAYSRGM